MSDGRFGEALVESALGLGILAWVFDGAAGGSHHADGVEALDGDELGLGFQQDVADLLPEVLVASLDVAAASFALLGDGVLAALAVTRLAGDVALVLALFIAASPTAQVVGAVPGANSEVVLGAAVGPDDVLWALDDQFCNGRRLRYTKGCFGFLPVGRRQAVMRLFSASGWFSPLRLGRLGSRLSTSTAWL